MLILGKGTVEEMFRQHSVSNSLIQGYMENTKGKRLASLPICPKCERAGLRDKGWATDKIMSCPHCGYRGKTTHQMSAYIKEGLYR